MSAVGSPELWPWVGTAARDFSEIPRPKDSLSLCLRARVFLRQLLCYIYIVWGRGGRLGAVTPRAGPGEGGPPRPVQLPCVPRVPCPGGGLALAVPLLRGTGVAEVSPFPVGR